MSFVFCESCTKEVISKNLNIECSNLRCYYHKHKCLECGKSSGKNCNECTNYVCKNCCLLCEGCEEIYCKNCINSHKYKCYKCDKNVCGDGCYSCWGCCFNMCVNCTNFLDRGRHAEFYCDDCYEFSEDE